MKRLTAVIGAGLIAVLTAFVPASADQLTGGFSISANGTTFQWVDTLGGSPTGLGTATALEFTPGAPAGNFQVDTATGSFVGLLNGAGGDDNEIGSIKDFQFTGGTFPIIDFELVGNFAFDLTAITFLQTICSDPGCDVNGPNPIINIQGTGIFRDLNGILEATAGTFSFSGVAASGAGATTNFSFTATHNTVPSVPEPATLLLLGSGLVAAGVFARKRR